MNDNLHEEVQMSHPLGITHQPGDVFRFQKALCGLKQAPRVWFENIYTVIISIGFTHSNHDSTLFVRCTSVC